MTPREIGRLMGVDDESISIMESCGLSNHALYRMYGNSIVVDVMEHIFEKLFNKSEDKNIKLW